MKLLFNFMLAFALTLVLLGLIGVSGPYAPAVAGLGKVVLPFLKYKPDLEPK